MRATRHLIGLESFNKKINCIAEYILHSLSFLSKTQKIQNIKRLNFGEHQVEISVVEFPKMTLITMIPFSRARMMRYCFEMSAKVVA